MTTDPEWAPEVFSGTVSGYGATVTEESKEQHEALLDTGASMSMFSKNVPLQNKQPCNINIDTAGDQHLTGVQCGDVTLSTTEGVDLRLNGVITHSQLSKSLVSVSAVLKKKEVNCVAFYAAGFAQVEDTEGNSLLRVPEKDGVYPIRFECNPTAIAAAVYTEPSLLMQVHRALGHAGWRKLGQLKHSGAVKGLENIKLPPRLPPCAACQQGKMTQLPFRNEIDPKLLPRRPLDMVCADLQGPLATESHGGASYVLVLKDVYSAFAWCYFLKRKSDAAAKL